MKTIMAVLILIASGVAHADAGNLKCSFADDSKNKSILEGKFDGKVWNIVDIDGDEVQYSIPAKFAKGQISYYIDTADETGGDPDYTDIYDITIYGDLKYGKAVKAKLEGNHFSRNDGSPYTLKGICSLN